MAGGRRIDMRPQRAEIADHRMSRQDAAAADLVRTGMLGKPAGRGRLVVHSRLPILIVAAADIQR
jgi:hypothetical protein